MSGGYWMLKEVYSTKMVSEGGVVYEHRSPSPASSHGLCIYDHLQVTN